MDFRLARRAVLVALSLAWSPVLAQTSAVPDSVAPAPLPPPPELGPAVEAPPRIRKPKVRAPTPTAPVEAPPSPPLVLRSPVAVLQVLDKVTAETLRFEAPVGKRVRYKTLVVEVKACETRGYDEPQPRASAYLVIDSRTAASTMSREAATSEVFHGWVFATSPALNTLQHPVYDLWLVACSASRPAS